MCQVVPPLGAAVRPWLCLVLHVPVSLGASLGTGSPYSSGFMRVTQFS